MADTIHDKIIHLQDHRWIEIGSDEWQREVMEAINETIDRLKVVEDRLGIDWKAVPPMYDDDTTAEIYGLSLVAAAMLGIVCGIVILGLALLVWHVV